MKNIQFSSREADRKVVVGTASVLVPALAGYLLPSPFPNWNVQQIVWLGPLITVALAVFAWGFVNLMTPVRYSQKWLIAERIAVPLVWIALVAALMIWLRQFDSPDKILRFRSFL